MTVLLNTDLFHPWPADKRGGSDPDVCPACGQTTHRRALRWDGSTWRRLRPAGLLTCSRCSQAWAPAPIEEGIEPSTSGSTSRQDASTPEEVKAWSLA